VAFANRPTTAARGVEHQSADLLALLRDIATYQQSPSGDAMLQLALGGDVPDANRTALCQAPQSAVRSVLEPADARGGTRSGIDPRLALETLVGLLVARTLTQRATDDEFLQQLVDLVVTRIGAG